MQQNLRQFRPHQLIRVLSSVVFSLNAAPRRTEDESIRPEWFHLQEIHVDELEGRRRSLVDLQVVLQHRQLLPIDIVYYILLKTVSQVNGNAADPTERLEHTADSSREALFEIQRHRLRDDRVPALLINADPVFKPGEEVVALVEVPSFVSIYLYNLRSMPYRCLSCRLP
jgi:hypothetical protein